MTGRIEKHATNLVRAAVVGCGPVGAMHAAAAHRHPAARVVAVCAPSAARRDPLAEQLGVAAFSDLRQLLTEVECHCVFVASPNATHVQLTQIALEADKHVFSEKPLGYSAVEARGVSELASRRNLCLGVNYNRRFGFGYQRARRLLQEDEIGEVRQLWLQVSDGTPPPSVADRRDVILWTLLTHHFDLINYLGGQVQRLYARMITHREDGLIDDVNVVFELRSGATAHLAAAYRDGQLRTMERCEFVGSRGGIVVDDVTQAVRIHKADCDDLRQWQPNSFLAGNAFYASLDLHIADFLDRLVAGKPPSVTASDAAAAAELAEAAVRSHQQGAWIRI